jgi:hypothetical protein
MRLKPAALRQVSESRIRSSRHESSMVPPGLNRNAPEKMNRAWRRGSPILESLLYSPGGVLPEPRWK